ncbi:MAG: MarR family transcriptional regulator [Oscillospiraceae bacterium]|nr:MarR family transcriptional regulator [Oscillospiraceae bacterium]
MREAPDLGRMIAYCSRLGMLYNERRLRQAGYDVTPVQSCALIHLSLQGEQAVTQRDLEKELRLKPSTVNGIVNRLEEKGYVARRTSPADGRCRLVSLTEAGRKQVEAFEAIMDGTGQWYARCFSDEEAKTLADLLARMIENLENEVNNV